MFCARFALSLYNKNKKYEKLRILVSFAFVMIGVLDFVGADVESIDVECEAGIEWRF